MTRRIVGRRASGYPKVAVKVGAARFDEPPERTRGAAMQPRPSLWQDRLPYGCVTVSPVTIASVLCANRTPYTPSVDLSLPAPTTPDFG